MFVCLFVVFLHFLFPFWLSFILVMFSGVFREDNGSMFIMLTVRALIEWSWCWNWGKYKTSAQWIYTHVNMHTHVHTGKKVLIWTAVPTSAFIKSSVQQFCFVFLFFKWLISLNKCVSLVRAIVIKKEPRSNKNVNHSWLFVFFILKHRVHIQTMQCNRIAEGYLLTFFLSQPAAGWSSFLKVVEVIFNKVGQVAPTKLKHLQPLFII